MTIELHPEAEEELFGAAAWYDDQRLGLGEELLAEIERWLDVLAETPRAWPRWPGTPSTEPSIRRILTDRFPYAIAYQVFDGYVLVLAFAHCSRAPLYWIARAGTAP